MLHFQLQTKEQREHIFTSTIITVALAFYKEPNMTQDKAEETGPSHSV